MKFMVLCAVLFVIAVAGGTYFAVSDLYIYSEDSVYDKAIFSAFVALSVTIFVVLGYISQIKNNKTIVKPSVQSSDDTSEYKSPIPKGWWLIFAGAIVWAIGYWVVLYPTYQPSQTDKYDDTVTKHIEKYRYTLKNIDKNSLVAMGRTIFSVHCVSCHGADAEGMQGTSRDLTMPRYQGYGVVGLSDTIRTGKKGKIGQMPSFAKILTDKKIEAVSIYLLSLGIENRDNKNNHNIKRR